MINDVLGLRRVIGMLLVNDDDEVHAAAVSLGNAVIQILALTVPDCRVALFRDEFPIYERSAFCRETVSEGIEQILGIPVRSYSMHFLTALLLQITLTGAKPDDSSIRIDLAQVFIHKADQDNRLPGAGRRFDNDGLLAAAVCGQV